MRLIDVDKLKKHYAWWEDDRQKLFDEIVDRQPTIEMLEPTKWYLCKDRLPELEEKVLVTVHGHDVIVVKEGESIEEATERIRKEVRYVTLAVYSKDRDADGHEWTDWFGIDGWPMIVKPVAWTPLPEAYGGEE